MNNAAIDAFFKESGLSESIETYVRPPNAMWMFQAGRFPCLIQTQESANRMRIVAFIADASRLDREELVRLMEANYHSALDARYALTDDKLVSVFLHPFAELSHTQFVLGLYQTISCAETCGSTYTGGTMVFGRSHGGGAGQAEGTVPDLLSQLRRAINRQS